MSAASANVPTESTPVVLPSSLPDPPTDVPNPAAAAVRGPCGLAPAFVPAVPGNAGAQAHIERQSHIGSS